MATQKEATLRLYTALNAPAKAGRVWVQYERKTIDAALDVLKQLMVAQGYEFRPADALPYDEKHLHHPDTGTGWKCYVCGYGGAANNYANTFCVNCTDEDG